jgi:hypothetical protein
MAVRLGDAEQEQISVPVRGERFRRRERKMEKFVIEGGVPLSGTNGSGREQEWADIVMCDPHRAIVTGPRRLRGERVESPDIRAGMAMLLAALCAKGKREIGNIRQIDRGYERIDERLRELGAQIERVAIERVHA